MRHNSKHTLFFRCELPGIVAIGLLLRDLLFVDGTECCVPVDVECFATEFDFPVMTALFAIIQSTHFSSMVSYQGMWLHGCFFVTLFLYVARNGVSQSVLQHPADVGVKRLH